MIDAMNHVQKTIEEAYEFAETLTEVNKIETPTLTIFTGFSPDIGAAIVIIPPMGPALVMFSD